MVGYFDFLAKKGQTPLAQEKQVIRQEYSKTKTKDKTAKAPKKTYDPGKQKKLAQWEINLKKRKKHPLTKEEESQAAHGTGPRPAPKASTTTATKRKAANGRATSSTTKQTDEPTPRARNGRKRAIQHQRLESSDESDSESEEAARKKVKVHEERAYTDPDRKVLLEEAFTDMQGAAKELGMIHAADIASPDEKGKFKPAFEAVEDDAGKPMKLEVELQYPSNSEKERYSLVNPVDTSSFQPVSDILTVLTLVPTYYLPTTAQAAFISPDDPTSLLRRLKRAVSQSSLAQLLAVVADYNRLLTTHLTTTLPASLPTLLTSPLPLPLVEHILTQTYARTVSPTVDSLRKYANGTDNVYGELLPRFISQIFTDTGLASHHTFVDLGSGVANVVLQASLQTGCAAYGCEMMPNACTLAAAQLAEYTARTRLWGLATGPVHLERGDFLTNAPIHAVLKTADVVLVNNQAFTPTLNQGLLNMFLDLKEGCWIVSLKSFVPAGHKISKRNVESVVNLLEVEEKRYWGGYVSWTDAPGGYVVSRKSGRRLEAFMGGKGK